jgi:hypothetical protein
MSDAIFKISQIKVSAKADLNGADVEINDQCVWRGRSGAPYMGPRRDEQSSGVFR